jgi:hypothetical protein
VLYQSCLESAGQPVRLPRTVHGRNLLRLQREASLNRTPEALARVQFDGDGAGRQSKGAPYR